jgi:hypothetical protein
MREPDHVRGMVVEQMQSKSSASAVATVVRAHRVRPKLSTNDKVPASCREPETIIAMRPNSRTATALMMLCLSSACKQQHSQPSSETSTPESAAQPHSASAFPATVPPDDAVPVVAQATSDRVITVRAVIANLPTDYAASFAAERLRSIAETRTVGARRAQGRYEFYGARLTRYAGEQLHSTGTVQLEFDLQGALISQLPASSAQEVEAIKSRSQLLRSHALAQQATRAH